MTTDKTSVSEPEQSEVTGLRAYLRRPVVFLGAIALTTLGVVTLGNLYRDDTTNIAATGPVASAPSTNDPLSGGKLTI